MIAPGTGTIVKGANMDACSILPAVESISLFDAINLFPNCFLILFKLDFFHLDVFFASFHTQEARTSSNFSSHTALLCILQTGHQIIFFWL